MDIDKLSLDTHQNITHGIQIFYHQGESIYPVAHSHNFYEIFIVVSGNAKHYCNNITKKIGKSSLVFIRPNDIHQYLDSSEDFVFYNLVFSLDTAKKLFSLYDKSLIDRLLQPINPPEINVDPLVMSNLETKLDNDIGTLDLNLRSLYNVELLSSLIPLFISSNMYNIEIQPKWFQNLLEVIEKDKNYTKGLNFLYNVATRSKEHVSRNFRKYLNTTPTDYLNNKKIIYASNLLRQTNIEIIDIGEMAGFNSLSHFYHLFKKVYKISPRLYRINNSQSLYKN